MQARLQSIRQVLPIDWSTLHKVLRDETRKKIILTLQTYGPITYTDLMNRLEITNTGRLNYHLKMLNDLVAKIDQGAYMLTERGKAAAELLEKFPSQITANGALKAFDAFIIGLVGLLLTGIPELLVLSAASIGSSIPLTILPVYLLLVPSIVMWTLTTRRTNSHDVYNLLKGPIVLVGASYLIILLALFVPPLLATAPPPITTTTTTTQTLFIVTLLTLLMFPVIPLLGVLLIESVYRYKSR